MPPCVRIKLRMRGPDKDWKTLFLAALSIGVMHSAAASDEAVARLKMVREQITARGIQSPAVLAAMRKVPRHEFVPLQYRHEAYNDYPVSIGHGQTISQPYIVAYMTELLQLTGKEKVLEIGTGSGYQAAVLAELTDSVFSIEIVCELEQSARAVLDKLQYQSVRTKCGDGYAGWPEHAPFDRILLTASPPKIPRPLIDQLAEGGILIAPEGRHYQQIIRLTKKQGDVQREKLIGVRFVPMTGKAQEE